VHRASVSAYLRTARGVFDLVFADPPYDVDEDEVASVLGALVPLLAADALVVLERGARSPEPPAVPGLVSDRDRRYGDTVVWWLRTA
jgi:16S rRNA (guanine966-N2)-methyltransferase